MEFDIKLDIATGASAGSRAWKNKTIAWSALVAKLRETYHTNETLKEFLSLSKTDQGKIKDVGGYVGGYLRAGRRKPANVVHRQIITLDIDFGDKYFWDDFSFTYECAAVLHGTHKHSAEAHKYRLIIPLSREVAPDEYVAVSRKIAGELGIDAFDDTTFQTERLMFWQSTPKDQEYFFKFQDAEFLDPDEILAEYADWTDSTLWPTSSRKIQKIKTDADKQQDPLEKKGLVGAFCRTYDIHTAISQFLPEEYTEAGEDRYTYVKGSASGGLVTYDDKFAFSHHGTDPCSGSLTNAFDLVRVHRFGHLDGDSRQDLEKRKSFKAMQEFVLEDKGVKKTLASEQMSSAKYDFQDDTPEDEDFEENIDWLTELEIDGKGKYLSTASNLNLIFANDSHLQGAFKQNDFDTKRYVFKSLPWRKVLKPEPVKNVDYSGVRNYVETIYGIAGNLKIDDCLALEFEKNSFHPIQDYLAGIKWDGVKRAESMLVDYLGAEDNLYTREAARKMLCGAVARIDRPGTKFDLVLTLVGSQGAGKSTLINKLGGAWFSDTFMSVTGKDSFEQLQGAWLMEMAELAGLRKAEIESVKHYISKQEDTFRPAYGRVSETYKRQCVFIGTTNKNDFLNDPSGNRRFMPVDVCKERATKSVFDMTPEDVAQIWAEAVQMYEAGEKLYLSDEAELLAKGEQIKHSETDERVGIIEQYLDTPLPEDWKTKDIYERRSLLSDDLTAEGEGEDREYVCVAEVWCECLGRGREDMDRYKTREVNEILRGLEGWSQSKSTKNFPLYGKQKYYYRDLS